jgi:hypothetical protein
MIEGAESDLRFEVRAAPLHEPGHCLGLAEDDPTERGLKQITNNERAHI